LIWIAIVDYIVQYFIKNLWYKCILLIILNIFLWLRSCLRKMYRDKISILLIFCIFSFVFSRRDQELLLSFSFWVVLCIVACKIIVILFVLFLFLFLFVQSCSKLEYFFFSVGVHAENNNCNNNLNFPLLSFVQVKSMILV